MQDCLILSLVPNRSFMIISFKETGETKEVFDFHFLVSFYFFLNKSSTTQQASLSQILICINRYGTTNPNATHESHQNQLIIESNHPISPKSPRMDDFFQAAKNPGWVNSPTTAGAKRMASCLRASVLVSWSWSCGSLRPGSGWDALR